MFQILAAQHNRQVTGSYAHALNKRIQLFYVLIWGADNRWRSIHAKFLGVGGGSQIIMLQKY
jgi:hypothetical protein